MADSPTVVLIVEDEPELTELYVGWLGDDYEIRTAADGTEALDRFDGDVDIVLLDRRMPGMSGDEVLGSLRERGSDCRVAMLTAVEPTLDLLKLDVDEYVTKPIDREELEELIADLERRNTIGEAIDSYLSLLSKKRAIERERSEHELDGDTRYEALGTELRSRRQRVDELLAGFDTDLDEGMADEGPPETAAKEREDRAEKWKAVSAPARYEVRTKEFYVLWLVAALTYGFGDIVSTTVAVFSSPEVSEANPVIATVLENFGLPGFLLAKLLVFLVLLSISVQGARTNDRFSYYWPPLVATVLGIGLTVWNVRLFVGSGGL